VGQDLLSWAFDEHQLLGQVDTDLLTFRCWFGLLFALCGQALVILVQQRKLLELVLNCAGAFERTVGRVLLDCGDDCHCFLLFLEVDFFIQRHSSIF
jgi:hypothetical protein